MNIRIARATLVVNALIAGVLAAPSLTVANAAPADFQAALAEYHAGHYEAAHAAFLSLAELGNCSAQFNLAAMALHGQGGPKDQGSAAGWLQAAAGNGCGELVANHLAALTGKLSPDEARAAADIMARYGPEALKAQGVTEPEFVCRDMTPPKPVAATAADTPAADRGKRQPAMVISALTVGADGRARDPEILFVVPGDRFAAAAVEAWLNSLFTPAQRGGSAVAARLEAKTLFADSAPPADAEVIRKARPAADAGDPAAAYLIGLAAIHDASLGIPGARAKQLLLGAAHDGNPDAQYWVASQLRASVACHPRANGEVWLRHAADGGNAAARLRLAQDHIGPEGTTKALVDVKNTGTVRGDEVAQLYIRDEVSSVTRPVKELRGFRRVSLAPGESKTIEFVLGPDALSFLNRDMHRVVEPGKFKIMAGGNSSQLIETTLTVDGKP